MQDVLNYNPSIKHSAPRGRSYISDWYDLSCYQSLITGAPGKMYWSTTHLSWKWVLGYTRGRIIYFAHLYRNVLLMHYREYHKIVHVWVIGFVIFQCINIYNYRRNEVIIETLPFSSTKIFYVGKIMSLLRSATVNDDGIKLIHVWPFQCTWCWMFGRIRIRHWFEAPIQV